MSCQLSVIVPCYNESKNIGELVDRITKVFEKKNIAGEIVLVNDGSADNTGQVMEQLRAQFSNLVTRHHETNEGIEAGWNTGLKAATGRYACFIDADLQNLPEDIWRLYREIVISKVDLVQGYRSSLSRQKDSRYWFSKGLNCMLNLAFGMHQRDNKSGFVIALRETLEDILRHRCQFYYFQTFITVSAASKGYSIREIETLFENRLLGKSFMSAFPVLVMIRVLVDLIKALVEFKFFPKHESIVAEFITTHKPGHQDPPPIGMRKLRWEVFFFTMPLHKWLITRQAKLYYDELKQSQYLKPEEIKALQEKKLRKLIAHAYKHVGYWRELMDRLELTPEDIQTNEDLQKLSLLGKQDVREHLYFDLLSDNHDKAKVLKVSTSGSTGEPFICFADQHQLEIRWASTMRSLEWTGFRFGDRCARLWHQTLGMTPLQLAREKLDAWFNNRLFIPAFEMSDANISSFVRKLQMFKPVLIDGYAESFNFLAYYVKSHKLEGLNPKALVSSAQALPDDSREIIEKSFGCSVFDKYGSREFSGIAYECGAHDGHHIVAESYIVEILKDGVPAKPGELGEVVVTDLNNFCMPMIRYRVGDLAVAMNNIEPCACGRGLPRIGKIEGRVQAIIFGTNGTYMPGTFFHHLFKDYDHIVRQYQVVQHEKGAIDLKVIKAKRFDEETFAGILTRLRQFLGEDMKINIEFVDHIAMVRTGKHQGVISKLKIDFQTLPDNMVTTGVLVNSESPGEELSETSNPAQTK
jgi:phenylacetate-CoA ligase